MFNKLKIKLTITQLVSSSFFLGYNKKIRNSKSNFFIIGELGGDDIFNIQLTLTLIKKTLFLLTSFFKSNCRV
jgi:ribosomal protein S2